jgi:xylose isomerase
MNRLAVITAFLGGTKNRYMTYQESRDLAVRFDMAARIKGCDGVELCYPADFDSVSVLKELLERYELGISAINFRSRRSGKWWRGSFSSSNPVERQEVVDDLRKVMDIALELGCGRITTCPLNDGTDTPFESDYVQVYDAAVETFSAICDHNKNVKLCIEYKRSDPRARCLFGTAGETAAFCQLTGADNLGVTLDIGHALFGNERPAQSAVLLSKTNRLFYIHLNDNDGQWDWDMIPGVYHFWDFIEFFYTLSLLGYEDDWYAFDVFPKEKDTVQTFSTAMHLTRKLEGIAHQLSSEKLQEIQQRHNPAEIAEYLYSLVVGGQ